jgi:uncharacterized membrane protein
MKVIKLYIPIIFIFLYIILIVTTVLYFSSDLQEFKQNPFLKDFFPKTQLIPDKPIVDYLVSIIGFFLTALGFLFVVVQISALADQTNKQEEQYHKDSEFKNFLEATKTLTSVKNKNNVAAQISAMYLLYDYAKNHSKHDRGNLEKAMKVLNRYATPAIYDKQDLIYTYTKIQ